MILSPGKVRALQTTSSANGTFQILAIDHRDSLRVLMNPDNPSQVSAQAITDLKMSIVRKIAPYATAVMLDPVYSAVQGIVTSALPGTVGFLCALEAQGYAGEPTARETQILNGWSVEKAKRLGASGIKLLVYYHPDAGEATDIQEQMIRGVVKDCARYDIPLFLEPLYYSPDPNISILAPEFTSQRRRIVTQTVRRLGALQPDILKIQFPIDVQSHPDKAEWVDACSEVNDISPVPWALLSGGDPFDSFKEQVEVACQAGASGYMVGRALWRELITVDLRDHQQIVDDVTLPRFQELKAMVDAYGHDWRDKHNMPTTDPTWYSTY